MNLRLLLSLIFFVTLSCSSLNPPKEKHAAISTNLPLDLIKLPEGFSIDVFAVDVPNARSLEWSPNGTLFVSTRGEGKVYALKDTDGDYKSDEMYVLASGLKMPNGVAFLDGDLYVAEISRILCFRDIENHLDNPPAPEVIFDGYPKESHHGWKYIAFGPDGKLYVPVGAPCNICESEDEIFNTITRMNPDGSGLEIVQTGIRNSVGFTWHPETGELWFTDNGRDWLGDNEPACELNYAPQDGMHFGFPYCHQGDLPDPEFGAKFPCSDFTPPAQKLGAHVAPLGLEFIVSKQFPNDLQSQVLIAEHGSWNRSTKSGYKVSMVRLEGNKAVSYEDFATGWLDKSTDEPWGRPVDLEWLPDGSLLVSDDFADV
ncbi:MAG: sorbosone dehydrogenase family protein, partial [Saprospiraceae bacterium]|nr:sorbosone dehydrogenase family protein [Saprospiraceae bacterium]